MGALYPEKASSGLTHASASGPSSLNNRVKSFELDPCICGSELPINSLACRLAFLLPSADLTPEHFGLADPPVEALPAQYT
jgi:hypothetical protein